MSLVERELNPRPSFSGHAPAIQESMTQIEGTGRFWICQLRSSKVSWGL